MEKKIKFFGILRKYGDDRGFYETTITAPLSVQNLKTQLKQELSQKFQNFDEALIDDSALASESEVLNLHSLVPQHGDIVLLPPVCGG